MHVSKLWLLKRSKTTLIWLACMLAVLPMLNAQCTPPTVSTHPSDAACCNYTNASFTVAGTDVTAYQWQVSTNGGATFTNISNGGFYSGATTDMLQVITPLVSMSGYKYRCELTGGCAPVATSNFANLTVTQGPQFTQHPQNATICDGGTATFSATISASGFPSYSWYFSYDGGVTYNPVPNAVPYSGANTSTLTITNATGGMSSFMYRVKLGNSSCANASPPSNSATLTVQSNLNYYQDFDGDGYGNALVAIATCTGQPVGYVTNNGDCNDNNAAIKPGGSEICGNGIDEDCNTVDLACGGPNTWLGYTTQWSLGTNWSSGAAPTASTDALIPSSPVGGLFPQSAIPASVHDLEIQDGATAAFNQHINVYGHLTGGATSNCVVQGNGGLINLCGTQLQTISGKCLIKKVSVNNTSVIGINIDGDVQIKEMLKMQDGDVNINGSLTLLSDASGTAFIDFFSYPVTGFINGNVTMQRYIANTAAGYHDISMPVMTTVADLADDFSITGANNVNCWYAYSPYPTLQEYREDANADTDNYFGGFWSVTSAASYLEPGKGYAARIYNAPLTIDVTGQVNYGSQFLTVTNTASGNTTADGWNLVGNPYPAPIKWSEIKNNNPGATDGSCYRFATTGEYAGTWSTHNGVTGVPTGTTDEIATFQGFFVKAPASNFLYLDMPMCTGTATPFYKTGALENEIRLQLTNGTNADEIVTYTDAAATTGYDMGHDGVKIPAGGAVNLSFDYTGEQYAINVLNEITAQTQLPLNIQVSTDGPYTLNALELNLSGLTAYLKDAQTNTLTALTSAPVLNLATSANYSGRYSVVFEPAVVSGVTETIENPVRVYANKGTLTISRSNDAPAQISVANVLGQQLAQVNTGQQKTELTVPATAGYVFVKVQEGTKVSVVKVLVNN